MDFKKTQLYGQINLLIKTEAHKWVIAKKYTLVFSIIPNQFHYILKKIIIYFIRYKLGKSIIFYKIFVLIGNDLIIL